MHAARLLVRAGFVTANFGGCGSKAACYSLVTLPRQHARHRTRWPLPVFSGVTRLLLALLALYKRLLSPLLGQRCRFHPSCADYARAAIARHGALRGGLLAGWRILRCQPLCSGGLDPVPAHFHLSRCHPKDSDHERTLADP